MEPMRVELKIKNAAYFSLLDVFNERLIHIYDISWQIALPYHERAELLKKEFKEDLKNEIYLTAKSYQRNARWCMLITMLSNAYYFIRMALTRSIVFLK